jgi:lipopolysaccharide export system permease protein
MFLSLPFLLRSGFEMKKIDQLVLKTFAGPFLLTFFITLFIIVMQFLWKYVDEMIGKGLEWSLLGELIFYASASFVPLALPLAVLLSSIMTFGSLGEYYELVALKASGVSLFRFMQPLIITVVFVSVSAFYFSNNILPIANLKFGALLHDIRHQKPALNIKPGIFYTEIQGFSIRVAEKEPDNRTLHDIMIYDFTTGRGNENVLIAERGEMYSKENGRFLYLKLFDGVQYQEVRQKTPQYNYEHNRTYFDVWEKIFDLSDFSMTRSDESLWKNHYQMMNLTQLENAIDTLKNQIDERKQYMTGNMSGFFSFMKFNLDSLYDKAQQQMSDEGKYFADSVLHEANTGSNKADMAGRALNQARNAKSYAGVAARDLEYRKKNLAKHEVEWHRKFTLSVACLVLFFVGAPLGALIRKGGFGMPIFMSILFFVIFHVFSMSGERIAEEGSISPLMGMWLSIFVLLPFGVFLSYKAMNDSPLLSMEWYYRTASKFFMKKK